eukprot:Sspe_Gene.114129::Locus_99592_Transcript_1_1_Confidence_1.000_Length_381::g.114129::m.114129
MLALPAARSMRALARGQSRGIHSVWGGFPGRNGLISDLTGWSNRRGSYVTHFEMRPLPDSYSSKGKYLASMIADDTRRLLATDWTTDFSGFWRDQVEAEQAMFGALYKK